MNIKTLTAVTIATGVILVGGVGFIGGTAVSALQNTVAPNDSTFIDGVPAPDDVIDAPVAPLIATPSQLAAGAVTLEPGQALLVVLEAPQGRTFPGTGGSDDESIVQFEASDGTGDAAFFAQKPGKTSAWIAGADGQRVSFDVTVATP
ncbi:MULTISPECIES: hypothetical protein [Microbacterium]|uniref:hypothetical protein n=1 Tax=Microbacterium TaxID=33882 RepID=UPI0027821A69|nr:MULTISPECIES: hypothetical protein [Microbacterium]MDQ1082607.1 hypothetical protein [Microbacterium sp. SORGH_AS_0344]MDQ1168621.1 hypothetical protein [Microbacterium proteolyticum]